MTKIRNLPLFSFLAIALAFTGCATLKDHALSPVPAAEPHPTLGGPLAGANAKGLRYNGPNSHQDYLLLSRDGARAEMIYTEAVGFRTAVYFPEDHLHALTEGWRYVGAPSDWGPERSVEARLGRMRYASFEPAAGGRACVAFLSAWDITPGIPLQLPGKTVFGYYCAPSGQALSNEDARRLLRSAAMAAPANASGALPELDPRHPTQAAGVTGTYGYMPFPRLFTIYVASERAQGSN